MFALLRSLPGKISPCRMGNDSWLHNHLYGFFQFATVGTDGCPCCAFFRGLAIGGAAVWLM